MVDMNIADFHFLRPFWLLAIIPLIALVVVLKRMSRHSGGWQSVLPTHLYQHLVAQNGLKSAKPPFYILTTAWLLASVALAGPTWLRLPQPVYQLNSGKVVVLDMSLSMRATDVSPNRLTRAKYKAIDLVKAIAEGETGLVAYAGDAFTISPLSSDAQNLTTLIPSLSPEIMPVEGSEPFLGLESAINLLHNAGYQQGEIFWITDGIENSQVAEVSKLLENSPYRLSVLGVGTADGAPIQLLNGDFLKDSSGAVVVPRLRASNLKILARKGKGRYIAMRTDDSDIDYLKNQSVISSDEEKEGEANENFGDKWQEMGPYLLLLLVPLSAYGFRRGLLGIFALFLLLPAYTPTASANWWDDMWQTKNQQGQQAFQAENYNAAAEHFEDPMWRGAAAYKAQDYDAALAAFEHAKGAQARYNEGNTLAQLGKLDEAIEAYDKALEIDPAHEDAKANKALLEQQKEQQEQQQQDNSDQQQGDDSQQNDNSHQSDNSEQGDNNQQGEQQNEQSSDQQQSQGSEQSQDGNSSDQSDANPSQPEDQPEQDNQGEQEGENEGDEPSAEQQNKDASAQQEEQDSSANNQPSNAMNDDQQLDEQDAQEQQASPAGVQSPEELTDEQKEQMQRMQTLLNRVPDDPAFLLKRKMQIENQKRRQQRTPTQRQRNW
ncbi:VWA domain-containing protein [Paraglaciecola agarilytica]|nr:VWA domain-containing protein [Paraglaciecola agarilytica]MBU3016442.1 VWA domain-containing protein [Paraglaciecola agarilytica]